MYIPFNKPFFTGKETDYIKIAVQKGHISGNGEYTKKCHNFFTEKYDFEKTLLTSSCTDALEMCALLLDIKEGDEVIVPSYTFVSTALAFCREGAKIVFADSSPINPNIEVKDIEGLITAKTKAIVVVHYAGIAVDMDPIMDLASKYGLWVVEDAAQAVDSYYKNRPLGGIAHLATFSFHETKNIISGEGGMLVINEKSFRERAEILWEKGTNRASFFRGEINKYGWVDTGSSFLPSEITAAFLYAQLENLAVIQKKRLNIWDIYHRELEELQDFIELPHIPAYATNNGHMFYILTNSLPERSKLIDWMKKQNIHPVFHYLGLHRSKYFQNNNKEKYYLPNSEKYEDRLLRLPFYADLGNGEQEMVIENIKNFYRSI